MTDDIVENIENLIASLELRTVGVEVQLRPQQTDIRITDDDGNLAAYKSFHLL